ncbi:MULTISPECIES: helix-turn-helix domain-containing protein [unclassified Streptomyces]|uniref:helix-turn-helix domain-containing protein n=1 Tax=unclassified Streptomyces TaxID=2593676 RepID=UPI0038024FAB
MGSQQQSWMFAEDRFGRRLRFEREKRGMTQADVARVLWDEYALRLHPTAIAKMEQRDAEKPRAIRLSEARAVADMFGLTVDEMMSTGNRQLEELAREFSQLGSRAEELRRYSDDLFSRLQSIGVLMDVPEGQVSPELAAYRAQIIKAMAAMYDTDEARRVKAEALLDEMEQNGEELPRDPMMTAATMAVAASPLSVAAEEGEESRGDSGETKLSVGQQLRQGRLDAGLTHEELEKRSRIRAGAIRAIEEDDFSSMPKRGRNVYARGHIRTLARELNLDAVSLVQQYDQSAREK